MSHAADEDRSSRRRRLLFAEEAEQAVLAAMLLDEVAVRRAADLLDPEDFGLTGHQLLFRAMLAVADRGWVVDPHTLSDALMQADTLEAAGGKDYIGFLIDAVPTSANIAYHAKIVRQYAERRRLADLGDALAELAREGSEDATTLIEEFRGRLDRATAKQDDAEADDDIGAQAQRVFDFLDSTGMHGLKFGFRALDAAVVPMLPGNFVEIAATSGSGKTTVGRNFCRRWVELGERVAFLSLEMTADEQLLYLACADTGIDQGKAAANDLTSSERLALWRAVTWWKDCQALRINDRGGMTPAQLLRHMRRYVGQGYTLFLLDHLHRVNYSTVDKDDLRVRIGGFAQDLKDFAKQHRVIVVALVQLVKMPPNEEPTDANIRESGKIIEEADKILFLWRPDVACERRPDGSLVPLERAGGLRYFRGADELPNGTVWGADDTRVYFKPGKQRIRPKQGLVVVRFDAAAGRMYDPDAQGQTFAPPIIRTRDAPPRPQGAADAA